MPTEPTPLPWHANSDCVIRDPDGERIAIFGGRNGEADCNYTLAAVNAHETLFATLRTIARGEYDNAHDCKAAARIAAAALEKIEPKGA